MTIDEMNQMLPAKEVTAVRSLPGGHGQGKGLILLTWSAQVLLGSAWLAVGSSSRCLWGLVLLPVLTEADSSLVSGYLKKRLPCVPEPNPGL